jgi:hypothetical protein
MLSGGEFGLVVAEVLANLSRQGSGNDLLLKYRFPFTLYLSIARSILIFNLPTAIFASIGE